MGKIADMPIDTNAARPSVRLLSFSDRIDAIYIETMHALYEEDPQSVPQGWREFFDEFNDLRVARR